MGLERMANESLFDYHKRLIYEKQLYRTLNDIDYSELSELVYGQSYSSDTARRMFYGSMKTLQLLDESGANASQTFQHAELDDKRIELRKEMQRFYDQRREYTKRVAEQGRREHIEDMLVKAATELKETVGTIYDGGSVFYDASHLMNNEALLVFCDWHYGMTVDNIWNFYNKKVCIERVMNVAMKAAQRIESNKCKKLNILLLGDAAHGAIHTGVRVASEELAADQIMQVSEIIAQTIEYLKNFVPEIDVYGTYGNHLRTVQDKKDSVHRDNMERLIMWWLDQRLRGKSGIRVMPESDNEFVLMNICHHNICASHGDLDGVKASPRLISTLFQKKYGANIEYILLADKHHRESFEELGVCSIICGCLCGADNFANDKRLYSTPEQTLFIINEENGIDGEYHLRCQ